MAEIPPLPHLPREKTMSDRDEITAPPSSGNVFADLGLPDAEDLLAKANLALHIRRVIRKSKTDPGASRPISRHRPAEGFADYQRSARRFFDGPTDAIPQ